jgi:small conductance mechanosensitive channel
VQESPGLDVNSLFEAVPSLVSTWGLKVIGALAVLFIGRLVAGSLRKGLKRLLVKSGVDQTLVPFLSSLAYYLAMTFVVIAVLGLFGIPTASLIAVLGAAGLAVGLALQGTLSNFAAGVMLLVFRPFRVGDRIETAGATGDVESIGIFTTTLNTPDNVRVIVPNSEAAGGIIKNFTANDTRRIDLVVGVSYDDDLALAARTIEQVLAGDSRVLADPAPAVAVSEMADSSINFVVRPWCATGDYWSVRFDLTRKLKEELEAAGCSIPFPQRDVHLHQVQATG